MPRSRPMADAASSTPAPRSSARAAWVSGVGATVMRGMRHDTTAARAKTMVARPSTHSLPPKWSNRAPGAAAMKPMTPEISDSLELASTSSSSECTTAGTNAERATWYDFASTSSTNASGNSRNECTSSIISRQMPERSAAEPMTIQRRPPLARSRAGPTSGATTAKGAMVSARYKKTSPRASPTSMEKNSVPARAMATRVSPATAMAWARARRAKGEAVNASTPSRGRWRGRHPLVAITRMVRAVPERPDATDPPDRPARDQPGGRSYL